MSVLSVLLFLFGVLALAWLAFRDRAAGFPLPEISIRAVEHPKREKKPPAPISGKCSVCGNETTLPFKCKYCKQLFCEEHRLPENHSCQGLGT